MKKTLKIAMIAVCMLCLLTGCYEQSSVISVNHLGNIKAEIAFAGNDEGIGQVSGGATYADLQQSMVPQIKALVTDVSKEKVEEIIMDKDGEEYKGVRITGYYSNLSDMYSSQLMMSFNSYNLIPAPVVSTVVEEGMPGVYFAEKKNLFGTSYAAKGTISMTQGSEIDEDQKKAMEKCEINIKFKFPVGAFTVSKGNSNFIMPTFKYAATVANDNVPVDFKVFLPNYLGILGTLIFVGLIVAVVLMARKIKELQAIINGEVTVEEAAEETSEFVSKDDENFFEGNEETIEINEEIENEVVAENDVVTEEITGEENSEE